MGASGRSSAATGTSASRTRRTTTGATPARPRTRRPIPTSTPRRGASRTASPSCTRPVTAACGRRAVPTGTTTTGRTTTTTSRRTVLLGCGLGGRHGHLRTAGQRVRRSTRVVGCGRRSPAATEPRARSIPNNAKNLIGSYVNMNIYESNNGGKTYTTISPGDPFPRFVSPIITDPTNSDHIVTLGQKVWETTEGFETTRSDWIALNNLGAGAPGDRRVGLRRRHVRGMVRPVQPGELHVGDSLPERAGVERGRQLAQAGREGSAQPLHLDGRAGPERQHAHLRDAVGVLAELDPRRQRGSRVRVHRRREVVHGHLRGPAGCAGELRAPGGAGT